MIACAALFAAAIAGTSPAAAKTKSVGPPDYGLTGFGATIAAWNAAHTADHRYAVGAVYDPDPRAPGGDDYVAVLHQDGHVFNYTENWAPIPIAQAKAKAMAEFPKDAHILWFVVKHTCAQMMVQSATVGKALGSKAIGSKAIGDSTGTAFIEFGSGANEDSYDPSAVNDALFQGYPKVSVSGAPAC